MLENSTWKYCFLLDSFRFFTVCLAKMGRLKTLGLSKLLLDFGGCRDSPQTTIVHFICGAA